MKTSLLSLLLFTIGLWPNSSRCQVPVKSPKCSKTIESPKNAAGVFFSEDCGTAFVLPPAEAGVSVRAISPNASLKYCSVVNGRLKEAESIQAQINSDIKRLKDAADAGRSQIDNPFAPEPLSAEEVKKTEQGLLESNKLQDDIFVSLRSYSALEAATIQVVFNSRQNELVDQYKQLNPGVNFVPLTIKDAGLSFARVGGVNQTELPSVLRSDVPGIALQSTATGKIPDAPKDENGRYSNEKNESLVFSHALSGVLTLSMMGACPFYNETTGRLDPGLFNQEMTGHMVANVDYAYDIQAYAKYHAAYNIASLVRRLQKSTTSGGLFFTSTAVELINEKKSSDWFQYKSDEDDSGLQLTQTEKDVKADLMDRVIRQIGYVKVEGTGPIPDPAAPPVHGAQVAADELQKCAHVYCQAAAILLRVGDAVFGGSEAAQNLLSTADYTATDDVEVKRMIRYRGSFTFVPEKVREL